MYRQGPHNRHHDDPAPTGHTETVVRVDSGGTKASWVAVAGLVLSLLTLLGGVAATVYERGAKEVAVNDLSRRVAGMEADGGRFAQLNSQRITALENATSQRIATVEAVVAGLKVEFTAQAVKLSTQGERLAEINGKLDTLLERTARPGASGSPAR